MRDLGLSRTELVCGPDLSRTNLVRDLGISRTELVLDLGLSRTELYRPCLTLCTHSALCRMITRAAASVVTAGGRGSLTE